MNREFRVPGLVTCLVLVLIICAPFAPPVAAVQAAAAAVRAEAAAAQQQKDQSFSAPEVWAVELTQKQGWNPSHARVVADMNGDGKQDLVGFGTDGVWVAISSGTKFTPIFVLAEFGRQTGWRGDRHVRTTGDINGDGRDDIVGFGDAGVWWALATSTGFGPATFVIPDLGFNQGWRVEKHIRLLADVTGDGRKDIVAFGDDGVWLAPATPAGFAAPAFVIQEFGYNQGWRVDKHVRTTADVNGDGRQDLVAFGDNGVWLALGTPAGLASPVFVLAEFGTDTGWRGDRHIRTLADVNADGRQDIVAFGDAGVWTALSTGAGFGPAQFVLAEFGYNQGWRVGQRTPFVNGAPQTKCSNSRCPDKVHPRFAADLNADGYADIVGFADEAIYRALGGPTGFGAPRAMVRALGPSWGHPWNGFSDIVPDWYPRVIGDVNGDGMQDLVAFDAADIKVVRSSDLPPPPPPAAPGRVRLTGSTTTSLSIAWNDNSSDERQFIVTYRKGVNGKSQSFGVGANKTTFTAGGLESGTEYCFTVAAESLFGISAPSPGVCGKTRVPTPTPTPTPIPAPQGLKSLYVFNCNSERHTVHIWTLDYNLGTWEDRGTLAAQWNSDGSCPGSAAPFVVQLADGHLFRFVMVDPQSSSCGGQNDPQQGGCLEIVIDPLRGDADGLCMRIANDVPNVVFQCN